VRIKGVLTAAIGALLVGGGVAVYLVAVRKPGGRDAEPASPPAAAPAASAGELLLPLSGWDGRGTFTCRGMDQVHLRGVTARLDGDGITATGNCELVCDQCTIEATRAISATGNALLVFNGGRISGRTRAAYAGSNAVITFRGAEVTGAIETGGFGEVRGLAPAEPPAVAAAVAAATVPLTPSPSTPGASRPPLVPGDPFAGAWTGGGATLTLAPLGGQGVYSATWSDGRAGLAMRAGDDRLYVAWGPADLALGVYQLHDGQLDGRWSTGAAAGATATERGARAARRLAARHRTTGARLDGSA
jgi:hypothetical protein